VELRMMVWGFDGADGLVCNDLVYDVVDHAVLAGWMDRA